MFVLFSSNYMKGKRTDKYAVNESEIASKVLFRRCANRFLFLVAVCFLFACFCFYANHSVDVYDVCDMYTKKSIKTKHYGMRLGCLLFFILKKCEKRKGNVGVRRQNIINTIRSQPKSIEISIHDDFITDHLCELFCLSTSCICARIQTIIIVYWQVIPSPSANIVVFFTSL